jgi:hypothetical protein
MDETGGYDDSEESDDDGGPQNRVACPLCPDFVGTPGSVAAHITGSKGEHEGERGPEYMDELEELAADDRDDQDDLDVEDFAGEVDPDDVHTVRREEGEDGEDMVVLVAGAGLALLLWRMFGAGGSDDGDQDGDPNVSW